jgi:hypothetical protein
VYHEFTHAYMFLTMAGDESWLTDGYEYYRGVKLENGDTADDPARVLIEAAAEYVAARAVGVLWAWDILVA